ncbi:MAG TPA: peptide chain release factor 1 [Firmicutes bacterium]|nr:peptide chain release factor 1 [Bacillota bacterium]
MRELRQSLAEIEHRYGELEAALSDPSIIQDREKYERLTKEYAHLGKIVALYDELKSIDKQLADAKDLEKEAAGDAELIELVAAEMTRLNHKRGEVESAIEEALTPKDPNDNKNVVMEIRAGTGGEEAALFAADLYRMYTRYADRKGWHTEVMSCTPTDLGGFKEIVFIIEGKGAYSRLKMESGVHRVQRIPITESSGRIHTSTATVAVLPEAEEVEVEIDPDELRIDVFCASGHGGQSVNTTYSAVRITHLPTGLVVSCQDEKSQLKNKEKAMRVLRSRLLELKKREQSQELASARRSQVGTGERSEKIRTYNFPQDRVTDHRLGVTLHNLEAILDGEIDALLEAASKTPKEEACHDGTASA